jgi:hypothetical protein
MRSRGLLSAACAGPRETGAEIGYHRLFAAVQPEETTGESVLNFQYIS